MSSEQNKKIWNISELNDYIGFLIENTPELKSFFLKGEIGNLSTRNRHMYLILKDDFSEISTTLWDYQNREYGPKLKVGDKVVIKGSIKPYGKKGVYNLNIEQIVNIGVGSLYDNFLKIKARLENEGLFDLKHKKPIPLFPERIAVITSIEGDAINDYIKTYQKRNWITKIDVYDTKVQGEFAIKSIINNLLLADKQGYDLIYLGRGGGSLEDLWAFNNEELAYVIFNLKTPIITGIGHERDVHIADYVGDYHAITPTAAALHSSLDLNELILKLDEIESYFKQSLTYKLSEFKTKLVNLEFNLKTNLETNLSRYKNNLFVFKMEIENLILKQFNFYKSELSILENNLKLLNPKAILAKGYTITSTIDNKIIKSVKDIKENEIMKLIFYDGDTKIKKG